MNLKNLSNILQTRGLSLFKTSNAADVVIDQYG